MKGKKISIFLLYLHIWKIVSSNNEISLNKNLHNPPLRSHHTFAKYWPYLSIIGGFGIFLNIFVLYSFYSERATIFTSVNIMIGYEDIRNGFIPFHFHFYSMDTMYRLVYSLFTTHWRNYIMCSDQNLFHRWLDLEMVVSEVQSYHIIFILLIF